MWKRCKWTESKEEIDEDLSIALKAILNSEDSNLNLNGDQKKKYIKLDVPSMVTL